MSSTPTSYLHFDTLNPTPNLEGQHDETIDGRFFRGRGGGSDDEARMMKLPVIAAATALAVFGQSTPLDPDAIVDLVNSGGDLKLPGINFSCPDRNCHAERLYPHHDLLMQGGFEAIVHISSVAAWTSRFLIFHCEDGCRLVDHIDRESRYEPAEAQVVAALNKRWFVVTGSTGGGSGARFSGSDWYEVYNQKLRLILSVPKQGYAQDPDPAITMSMRFVRYQRIATGEELEFAYHLEFASGLSSGLDSLSVFLWDDEWRVTYSRDSRDGKFKFNSARSTTPKGWNDDVLPYGPSPTQFIPYAVPHLLEIARNSRDPRRAWLKQLLNKTPTWTETEPIRAALKASER